MNNTVCLSKDYSTTRIVIQEKPKIIINLKDKFETLLFLPKNDNRLAEGGLRKNGYFKKSYENKPLVSIITVVFNGEKYLEETIKSVINQNYDNVEYIIIDGGSTDKTMNIIKKYEDKIDYWVSEKDKGLYDAFNKGITLCIGDFIGIISSDDWLESSAIINSLDAMNDLTNEVLYANLKFIKTSKDTIVVNAPEEKELDKMKKRMIVFHPSTFIKKDIYKKYGFYNSSFRIAADYDLLLRFYLNRVKFRKLNIVITNFREGGVSSFFTFNNLLENIQARINNKCQPIILKEFMIYLYFRLRRIFN